ALWQKVSTLLYPYFLWTFLLVAVQIVFSRFTNSERTVHDFIYILIQPREVEHMWYLLALFNTSLIYIVIWKVFEKYPVAHFVLAVALHFISFLLKDYSLFSDPFYHYIFLLIGVSISGYLAKNSEKGNTYFLRNLLWLTPLFIAGQY